MNYVKFNSSGKGTSVYWLRIENTMIFLPKWIAFMIGLLQWKCLRDKK